ncbi:uncharacterized protein F5891DRAFT_1250330 [Suillus fuscotomentosus]|uniref:Uncharacterized protein n=1 Tax=Suillus fuscotomentosus TaxID=1912939 RepID=A0AAD4E0F5_9AGAM|nr:uncharacterized protein F5891DRAFT_1250330 [Suillus fuscotomentosus]KAG1895983.1 hypothetical protein F5891DRAFT_1250330 [Suillus fuscotomentosus]
MKLVTHYLPIQTSWTTLMHLKKANVEPSHIMVSPLAARRAWSSSSWRLVFFISKERAASVFLIPPQPQPGEGGTEAWKRDREAAEQEIILRRRRQKKEELIFMDEVKGKDDIDSA